MDKLGILAHVGERVVSSVLVDGADAVRSVNKLTGANLDPETATGDECMVALEALEGKPHTETRAELDTDRIAQIVGHIRGRQSVWKTAVAVFMAILVGVVVIDYAILMYVATTGGLKLPSWQDVTFIIIVPGGIVWAWFGVLTKENRDLLAATIGELPVAGPMTAFIKAVLGRHTQAPQTRSNDTNTQSATTGGRQQSNRTQSRTGASDDVDDNPPPGAAM